MPGEPFFSAREITFSGNERLRPLQNTSLDLERGECVALIGELASGKTTLAEILAGIIPPQQGQLFLEGVPLRQCHAWRRQIQAIFSDPRASLNPHQTLENQLLDTFHLFAEKIPAEQKEDRVRKALRAVEIEPDHYLNAYPRDLGPGILQRVLLARIRLIAPALLIADEPAALVDLGSRWKILDFLRQLNLHFGTAIVFFTQDITQAFLIASRFLVLHQGKVVEHGPAREVVLKPRHPYTQQLLQNIPRINQPWLERAHHLPRFT